jgi:hypothetical protein
MGEKYIQANYMVNYLESFGILRLSVKAHFTRVFLQETFKLKNPLSLYCGKKP